MSDRSRLERLLDQDRRVAVAALAVLIAGAWTYTLLGAGLDMPAMVMTPAAWSPGYGLLILAMWWVMMIAMMVPSAAPMILLYAAIARKKPDAARTGLSTGAFLSGYLAVWAGFSALVTAAQWSLSLAGLITPYMSIASTLVAGFILLAAGLYQFTPLKQACLRHCRGPVDFIAGHWRDGAAGAWRMGIEHGAYCLGCCWFLMGLLFAGGIMNVYWITGIALFVLLEKLLPHGHWLGRAAGVALAAAGLWTIVGTLI